VERAELDAIVRAIIDRSELGILIRQLQGALGGRRFVSGLVGPTGTVVSGSGFSAARTGLGLYTVTFSPVFAGVPDIIVGGSSTAASSGNHAGLDHANLPTASSFKVKCTDAGSAVFADIHWSFVAIGPA
jgi:hypothetical protein